MTGVQTCALPISTGEKEKDKKEDMAAIYKAKILKEKSTPTEKNKEIGRASCRERV